MEEFTSQEDGMTSIDLSSFTGTDDISKRKNTMIANKLIKGLTDSGKINRVKPVDVSLKINTTGVDNPTAILLSALGESAQEGNVTIETKDNTPEENAIVIHKVVKNILPFLVAQGQANLAIKIDQNTLDQVKDPDDKKNLADFIEKGLIQPTASPDA